MPSKRSVKPIRVVLDTNNLVSAHINDNGASARILDVSYQGKIVLYSSPFQEGEFRRVLSYPRIKQKFKLSNKDIQIILQKLRKYAVSVYPLKVEKVILQDPDDDQILAIAWEAKVDYIISGDSHLLNLSKYKEIPIVTARKFLDLFNESR